jgi:hypothetical protein
MDALLATKFNVSREQVRRSEQQYQVEISMPAAEAAEAEAARGCFSVLQATVKGSQAE